MIEEEIQLCVKISAPHNMCTALKCKEMRIRFVRLPNSVLYMNKRHFQSLTIINSTLYKNWDRLYDVTENVGQCK